MEDNICETVEEVAIVLFSNLKLFLRCGMMKSVKSAFEIILAIFMMGANARCGIQEFLVDNGHHNVDIFYNSSQWHMLQLRDVFVSRLPIKDMRKANRFSFGIFVFEFIMKV